MMALIILMGLAVVGGVVRASLRQRRYARRWLP
jgi:hypothetical protein